jgi:hypothetical protein
VPGGNSVASKTGPGVDWEPAVANSLISFRSISEPVESTRPPTHAGDELTSARRTAASIGMEKSRIRRASVALDVARAPQSKRVERMFLFPLDAYARVGSKSHNSVLRD